MAEAATATPPSTDRVDVRPQPGPQTAFLEARADIVIAGGAAGGGKTYALLLEPLRHIKNAEAGVVFFRRTYPQITAEGGLWDDAGDLYPQLGGVSNETELSYTFPSGMRIKMAHMQHAKDRFQWKGAQVPVIMFDQLEDFEDDQFWYLLSRNRSARAGFGPYVRATCNPVPDDDAVGGWLNTLVAWWIDQETGYAIPERSGVVRWFVRINDEMVWADDKATLEGQHPDAPPRSLTFIPATLKDNPILERADPAYRGWLMALPAFERERLLMGNWKVKPEAGKVFDRANFKALDALPAGITDWCRYWDKAGTQDGGDWSAGVLVGRWQIGVTPTGEGLFNYVVADVTRGQWSALARERVIAQKADADSRLGQFVQMWVEQEPGSGGKESAEMTVMKLAGYTIRVDRVTGSKLVRASPLSVQVEAGNVYYVVGGWNEEWLAEHHRFNGKTGWMDQVDASSGAFNKLFLHTPDELGAALW